jgi:calcium channel MID1
MTIASIPPLWRRRRKEHTIALILYTFILALLTPWNGDRSFSLATTAEPELGQVLFSGVDSFGFGGQINTSLEKRASFTRDERNGEVEAQNLNWGDNYIHHLSATEIADSKTKTVHITFNTCLQPTSNNTESSDLQPPQLTVYVSNSTSNKSPGPGVQGKPQFAIPIDAGFGSLTVQATGDIWVGVHATALPDKDRALWGSQPWNYELAMSTGKPYHGYRDNQFLYLVDTDDNSALLVTGNMTDNASEDGGLNEMDDAAFANPDYHPYTVYAQNRNVTSPFKGLEKSYCAVRQLASIRPGNTQTSMTTRGLGNFHKQQFHLLELNRSTEYWAYLARPRNNSKSDTSGILWRPLKAFTKTDGNCAIIYDLPFCSEVAYAVPSNPTVFGSKGLTKFYDDAAQNWWQNFSYSLQQIQCNASSSAQYSLVRNCDDCAAAYKNWLCAVTIPRCMDYSSPLSYLAERSSNKLFWNATAKGWQKHPWEPVMTDQEVQNWKDTGGWLADPALHSSNNETLAKVPSRNKKIDEVVRPGAYREVRPCKDLCWTLVQSCPAPMGFSCPRDGSWGKEMSYGERDPGGDVTCSYLGAVYALSGGMRSMGSERWMWLVSVGAFVATLVVASVL